jgi:hypothetical protein
MENLTRFNQNTTGFFDRINWKVVIMVLVAVFAILAVSYNVGDDLFRDNNLLNGKVQRVRE